MSLDYAVMCRFRFVCNQKWADLETIAGETQRKHCNVCNESVHLASTYEELGAHAAAKRCVAIFVQTPKREKLEVMGDVSGAIDPVAEAEVYLAYGRINQAVEILQDALSINPEAHPTRLKLMELHFKKGDAGAFASLAKDLQQMTLNKSEEWRTVAKMGLQLDPTNTLYSPQ